MFKHATSKFTVIIFGIYLNNRNIFIIYICQKKIIAKVAHIESHTLHLFQIKPFYKFMTILSLSKFKLIALKGFFLVMLNH
jgi:hypothetical protein